MKKQWMVSLVAVAVGTGASTRASSLYGVEFSGLSDLLSISPSTGLISSVGPTGQNNLGDLTSDTRSGTERIWTVRIPSNELIQLNPATGAPITTVALNSPNNMVSIAFDPLTGKMYGNTSTGFGAPFDALYEINPSTGNTTFVGRILFNEVYALGFDQTGHLFGVSDATDDLISINTSTGTGTFVADLLTGLTFDIASRPEDNTMFLADSGTFSLYTVNTTTGALNLVGGYGGSQNVVGLAFLPTPGVVPEASTWLAAGGLVGLAVGARWLRRQRTAA